jgi:hypothetical protein
LAQESQKRRQRRLQTTFLLYSNGSTLASVKPRFRPSTATDLANKAADLQISMLYMDIGHNFIPQQPYMANVHARNILRVGVSLASAPRAHPHAAFTKHHETKPPFIRLACKQGITKRYLGPGREHDDSPQYLTSYPYPFSFGCHLLLSALALLPSLPALQPGIFLLRALHLLSFASRHSAT